MINQVTVDTLYTRNSITALDSLEIAYVSGGNDQIVAAIFGLALVIAGAVPCGLCVICCACCCMSRRH